MKRVLRYLYLARNDFCNEIEYKRGYMRQLFSILIITLTSLAYANANTYLKKIVDLDSRSTLFLACKQENQCRVLAGGSFTDLEVAKIQAKLTLYHRTGNAVKIGVPTVAIGTNIALILMFGLNVPLGAITFVGTSVYVYFKHTDFDTYKPIQVLEAKELSQLTTDDAIAEIENRLIELRGKK